MRTAKTVSNLLIANTYIMAVSTCDVLKSMVPIKKDLSDDTGRNVYMIPIMKIKIHVEMSSASFECLKKTNKLV